jgi:hypothetical protein
LVSRLDNQIGGSGEGFRLSGHSSGLTI